MLSIDGVLELEKALSTRDCNLKNILAEYLSTNFPEFEIVVDIPAAAFGINENYQFDIVARARGTSAGGNVGDVALTVMVKENLTLADMETDYARLAKLKSDKKTLQLQTVILAKTSPETLESIAAAIVEKNKGYPNAKWLDSIVILGTGLINYGAHDPTTQVAGNFLHHSAFSGRATIPALYIKLMAAPTKTPLQALMYRIAATLLVAWPSKRHKEVNSLSDTGLKALPIIDYQYNLQGQLKPMPENQYLDKRAPTFPIEIVGSDDEVLGHIEYLEWQDGGVLVLKGDFPLDIFLLFGGYGASQPIEIVRKDGVQISCLLPLSKRGFNTLLNKMQERSNFHFRSSRPPLVIQKVSNEGVSVPLIARVRMGLLTLRDTVPKSLINVDGYDRALDLTYQNLMNARAGLKSLEDICSKHITGLHDGTTGHVDGNTIHLLEPIDPPLRDIAEKFINNCGRALKTGMKDVIISLGGDINFFFKKDSTFKAGIESLMLSDPALAIYLDECRNEWSHTLITLRNNNLEHGQDLLTNAGHKILKGRIEFSEPTMAGRPLREVSTFIFDKLSKFIEEITVYHLQKKLTPGFAFVEIPLEKRDPTCATRFQLALDQSGKGWEIKYTDTQFEKT